MEHVQILLYTSYLHIIGGIETFVLNFCELMGDEYEIGVLCPKAPSEITDRIIERARFFQGGEISCDTLIVMRCMESLPGNVQYKRSIRMVHATKSEPGWYIMQDCDDVVHVSRASKRTFESTGTVIHNPLIKTDKKALMIVSATRIPALDKGANASRMLKLARMLNDAEIPFLWMNFSDAPLDNAPKGFVNAGSFQELQPYIARADYLVQLSDHEGFGYSVLEALVQSTAVIVTPFSTTRELGVIDGKNGYIVPFNMDFDVRKLLRVPEFTYTWNNDLIKKHWKRLFEKKKSAADYVTVEVLVPYKDIVLKKQMARGEIVQMKRERARYVAEFGFIRFI